MHHAQRHAVPNHSQCIYGFDTTVPDEPFKHLRATSTVLMSYVCLLLAPATTWCLCSKHTPQGCALDFFTTRSLTENDEARVSMDEYMSRRNGTCRHQSDKKSSVTTSSAATSVISIPTPAASPPRSPKREDSDASAAAKAPRNVDSPSPPWTENHVSVVREAIFGTLAGFARDALEAAPSCSEDHDITGAGERLLLLFNEQFVVKPPQSSIEFGWHTVRA